MATTLSKNRFQHHSAQAATFQHILAAERPRLVRLCTAIIQDANAAEDVAQEALLAAWHGVDTLRDESALRPWLSGIARNHALRWLRAKGKQPRLLELPSENPLEQAADNFDIETELERDELALLLDRALALLPAATRDVLVRRFVAELPYAAIADELGMSENVVAVRVHRGKLTLKKLLQSDLQAEAEALNLVPPSDNWRETRIWCTRCGQRRMIGRLVADEFALRCPDCNPEANSYHSQDNVNSYASRKTFRPALNFLMRELDGLFTQARVDNGRYCIGCGQWLPLRQGLPAYIPASLQNKRGLHVYCPSCPYGSCSCIDALALYSPAGRDFWRREKRIRILPAKELSYGNEPALHLPFISYQSSAMLDIILRQGTYEVLAAHSNRDNER
ncbi:MAG: RNA polymerase sigma factor [Chloroflexota bacterium]